MKKIGLFVVCGLLLQSFAWAGPKESLKSVLDEYRYAVTVEWDQNDLQQLEVYKAQFTEELKNLKLSFKELKEFLAENSRELRIEESEIALLQNQKGEFDLDRAQQMLDRKSKEFYMEGSSWAPEQILIGGIVALFVFEIVVLIITTKSNICPNPNYHPNDIPYSCQYE